METVAVITVLTPNCEVSDETGRVYGGNYNTTCRDYSATCYHNYKDAVKKEEKTMKKKRKARVVWAIEDCQWGTLSHLYYSKKDLLAAKGCPKCRVVKFIKEM